mmetsp:Transcript_24258/g.46084  ORF Transcript_24258/g.46084 Transcript_24258/m.46084 type:complete len:94 (+) Transcript_24258:471-752(+)
MVVALAATAHHYIDACACSNISTEQPCGQVPPPVILHVAMHATIEPRLCTNHCSRHGPKNAKSNSKKDSKRKQATQNSQTPQVRLGAKGEAQS